MGKNWVHIQDGTDYKGKFEIVITTSDESKAGATVTFEGKIVLNKDLGYGYFFEVLMEDAKIKKYLSDREIREVFDYGYHVKNVDKIFKRVVN